MMFEPSLSCMISGIEYFWQSCYAYKKSVPDTNPSKFLEISDLLLKRPELNSTYLFRADILYDSSIATRDEGKRGCGIDPNTPHASFTNQSDKVSDAFISLHKPVQGTRLSEEMSWKGYVAERTLCRRLVPRKPRVDKPLDQTCHILRSKIQEATASWLVVYLPHISEASEMPWYHPVIRGLAYFYQVCDGGASLSIHLLPFESSFHIPDRVHRTVLCLLSTFIRLLKSQRPTRTPDESGDQVPVTRSLAPADIKDTIVSQRLVQDTHTILKHKYAADLINRWVEKTDPAKHVFEDIAIAAFLIETWKQMYLPGQFPGFVDIACGNGILVYILVKEGYHGRGFDARRRRSWEAFGLDNVLDEQLCVPEPFADLLGSHLNETLPHIKTHSGIFSPPSFIISNHADELTPWTPILAALSSPLFPLPYLAIPCCSHALSGAKWRYSPPGEYTVRKFDEAEHQPASGDLKILRACKVRASQYKDDKSMYTCLTRKVIALSEEVGLETEVTLMRIPSTRNIGVVGGRSRIMASQRTLLNHAVVDVSVANGTDEEDKIRRRIQDIIGRECEPSGGIAQAARTWIERAQRLHQGEGRGKVKSNKPAID